MRAPIVLTATAAGFAGTLGFAAHEPASPTAAATSTTAPAASTSSSGSTASKASASTGSSSSSGTHTGTGEAMTQYGDVQLKVTVTDGKITAVESLALPQNDPRSAEISSSAGPQLQQSALSKQDGTVDAVSGATFTSQGYATALQAALDQAGFTPQATTH